MRNTALPVALLLGLATPALADVHVLTAPADGSQETPPVSTPGRGTATVTVDDATNYVHVCGSYSNLVADATAVHLHGLAAPGTAAGILFGLTHTGGTDGTFEGSAFVSNAELDGILDGLSYVNVHTTAHAAGEIRGQAVFPPFQVAGGLDGSQAGTGSPGVGTFDVVVDRNTNGISINGTYSGLLADITVAHLHGPAWFGQNAGIVIGLSHTGGTSGTLSGIGTLSDAEMQDVLDGFTYVNVHTGLHIGGEIRGQVFGPFLGTRYCKAAENSLGIPGQLVATGSPRVVDNDVTLNAFDLSQNSFGYFIVSPSSEQTFPVPGSQGRICVSGPNVGRLFGTIQDSGAAGTFLSRIDITQLPGNPPSSAMPGDTFNFQAWHRDSDMGTATSNFTNAVSISFR